MLKARISEIFQSIQGEGKYTGVRQVFVRFFGCTTKCTWCDTPASIDETKGTFKEYTVDELWDSARALSDGCHSISLTGGEPLLQADFLEQFLPRFKTEDQRIYLETNGIFYGELQKIIPCLDIIAMDIKLPSSAKCQPFWEEHEQFLKMAREKDVFVKTVISRDTDREDVLKAAHLIASIDKDIFFVLQPNHFELDGGVLNKCLEFHDECCKLLPNVHTLPQMHKLMKVR